MTPRPFRTFRAMTMTETARSDRKSNARPQNGDSASLADQVVLSGAGLASQGIGGVRRALDGTVGAVDALMNGAFDVADRIIASNLLTEVARRTLGAAREAWTIGVDTTRSTLGEI